jgi:hypothetical protein
LTRPARSARRRCDCAGSRPAGTVAVSVGRLDHQIGTPLPCKSCRPSRCRWSPPAASLMPKAPRRRWPWRRRRPDWNHLLCPESTTSAVHKAASAATPPGTPRSPTSSGRPARGIEPPRESPVSAGVPTFRHSRTRALRAAESQGR